jgi:hypothetical protein
VRDCCGCRALVVASTAGCHEGSGWQRLLPVTHGDYDERGKDDTGLTRVHCYLSNAADLPIVQSTKFELVINILKLAREWTEEAERLGVDAID